MGFRFKDTSGRLTLFSAIVIAIVAILSLRLWSLQVLSGEEYAARAESNRIREIPIDAPRGRILDREGRPLVTNRPSLAVVANRSVRSEEELLASLSDVLDVPIQELMDRVESVREDPLTPRVLAVDVDRETVAYLSENQANYPGVDVQVIPVRAYPGGVVAAHVLGYTGEISEERLTDSPDGEYTYGDLVGKSGAEFQFESVLRGDKGYRRVEVDASGRISTVLKEVPPVPGRDVVLSLDLDVQRAAEDALARAIEVARADGFMAARAASAVVLDVDTGEVVAMASLPSYDPTLFIGGISKENWRMLTAEGSEYPLTNRALAGLYPPASTFKVITAMAGLANGVTNYNRRYVCQGRWVEMGERWPKFCWDRSGHGSRNLAGGMIDSCNVVFYNIGYEFYKRDDNSLQEYARQWGLGQLTGIDLPGEVSGRIPDPEWKAELNQDFPEFQTWLPGEAVDLSIGQGDVLATPLQIASLYAGIANDGAVMRPTILREVLDSRGDSVVQGEQAVAFEASTSDIHLQNLSRMLRDVTVEGTAKGAFRNFPISVAGKTGTAQVANKDNFSWFAAFAPADQPRYALSIVVEQAGGGGAIAAPAAREIFSAAFDIPIERVTATDPSR